MTDILTPVGRLVYGNLYTPQIKKERDGKPKIGNDGQPIQSFDYGIAIPKGQERHWAETDWGQIIWVEGHNSFPNGAARRPDFAWKVTDGDSQIPNKANKRPCDKEGYAGHWILNFSSSFPSKYVNHDGSRVLLDGELIKPGYYVQIMGTVVGNKSDQSPGVYLNHQVVSLQSVFQEIQSGGVDPASVGFGQAPMPAGVQRGSLPAPGLQAPLAPPPAPGVLSSPPPPAYNAPGTHPAPAQTTNNYSPPPAPPVMGNPHVPPATPQHPQTHVAPSAPQTTAAPGAYPAPNHPGNVAPIPNYGVPGQYPQQ